MNAHQQPAGGPVADAIGCADLRTSTLLHPDDVLAHPKMSVAEKRATLASWASDARALENAPALRQLDNGAVVALDDILSALALLDAMPSSASPTVRPVRRPRSRRLLRQLGLFARKHPRDDDDDPPPCPAVIAPPSVLALAAA